MFSSAFIVQKLFLRRFKKIKGMTGAMMESPFFKDDHCRAHLGFLVSDSKWGVHN